MSHAETVHAHSPKLSSINKEFKNIRIASNESQPTPTLLRPHPFYHFAI